MLSGVQPCFQLLRIGSSAGDAARDLYTFRPALSQCVFRLGRAAELCDITLDAASVSRIHAELHAEREAGRGGAAQSEESWTVHIKDRSSHGTWVNEVRLQSGVQCELSDGDTLNFGGPSDSGSSEFYFLFQKVQVRPLDFDAITLPKAGSFSSDLQNRIRTSLDQGAADGMSKLSINGATVILSSIGSLSKMKGCGWSFRKGPGASSSSSSSLPLPLGISSLLPPSTPPPLPPPPAAPTARTGPPSSRSRRKSAHTVLLEDGPDEPRSRASGGRGGGEEGLRLRGRKRRHLYRSESDVSSPGAAGLPLQTSGRSEARQFEARPFPVGTRTIGSYHGAVTNSQLHQQYQDHRQPGQNQQQVTFTVHGDAHTHLVRLSPHSLQQKMLFSTSSSSSSSSRSYPAAPRGRRRLHSSPVYSPLVVGGENYSLASPSVRVHAEGNRFHLTTGKRRGRPRKHPLPPRPSLPSPSSSSSSSTSSASSSSSSSSSSSDGSEVSDEDEDDCGEEGVGGASEPCAATRCRLPQQDPVQWIQCDVCDGWYHLACLHASDRKKLLGNPKADFHCSRC